MQAARLRGSLLEVLVQTELQGHREHNGAGGGELRWRFRERAGRGSWALRGAAPCWPRTLNAPCAE